MALETLSFLFESTKVNSSAAIVHFFEVVSEKTGKAAGSPAASVIPEAAGSVPAVPVQI